METDTRDKDTGVLMLDNWKVMIFLPLHEMNLCYKLTNYDENEETGIGKKEGETKYH